MKIYFFLWIYFITFQLSAQGLTIHKVKEGKQISFYLSNTNFCPYQCIIFIDEPYQIVKLATDSSLYFTINAQTKNQFLFTLTPSDTSKNDLKYHSECLIGNPKEAFHDSTQVYLIPYQAKTRHWLIQGYNGRYSHRKQNALDFKMKTGTPITASRGGIVVKVRQDSNKGGKGSQFSGDANEIMIYHTDGTISQYLHLKHQGSTVQIGDSVKAGQIIGYSGNTGWSTTPHLHFAVKKPVYRSYETIKTKFWIRNRKIKYLKALHRYKAIRVMR